MSPVFKENEISYHFGRRISKYIKNIKKLHLITNEDNIKGVPSFFENEKILGNVKIFPKINLQKINEQIEDFLKKMGSQKEFILVLESSIPEMTPLIKRAKAIITDYGGINSHTGITSREFKVPCLVGTNIATKILKEGDKVEINFKESFFKKIPV